MNILTDVYGENASFSDHYFIPVRLPDCETTKIELNFLKISEKTEEIHKVVPEDQAYTSKQLKLLADKVKEFVPKEVTTKNAQVEDSQTKAKVEEAKNAKPKRAIIRSVSQLIAACKSDENVPEEQDASAVKEDEQSKAPEVHRNVKRVLENIESAVSKKKMKNYESPLEFLKLPDISNRKYDISLDLKFLINFKHFSHFFMI